MRTACLCVVFFVAFTSISACSSSSGGKATSKNSNPAIGDHPTVYEGIDTGGRYTRSSGQHHGNLGGSYFKKLDDGTIVDIATSFNGGRGGEGYTARSGFSHGDYGAAPASGSIVYDLDFGIRGYENVHVDNYNGGTTYLDADHVTHDGKLLVTADFDRGIFSGSGDGLRLDGKISGNTISGTSNFGGHSGVMAGKIDATHTVGGFHQADETSAHAGVFYGSAK